MKVRLISENIHTNKNFELPDNGINPVGWYASSIDTNFTSNGYWRMTNSKIAHSATKLTLISPKSTVWNYLTVVKKAEVRGYGSWFNDELEAGASWTLGENWKNTVDRYNTSTAVTLNRKFNKYINDTDYVEVKNISTQIEIEATALRTPQYQESKNFEKLIIQNKNSKSLEISELYNPISTLLQFKDCNETLDALTTFFKTCLFHNVGFTIEVWAESFSGDWSEFTFGDGADWGGVTQAGWTYPIKLDIGTVSRSKGSIVSTLDINVILQKQRMNYVL